MWDRLTDEEKQLYHDTELAIRTLPDVCLWVDIHERLLEMFPGYTGTAMGLASFYQAICASAPYDKDDLDRRYKEWTERNTPAPLTTKASCSCDIHLLMRSGCQCGSFKREREAKDVTQVILPVDSGDVGDTLVLTGGSLRWVSTPAAKMDMVNYLIDLGIIDDASAISLLSLD